MKTLVVGGSGFIGSYLMNEIEADNLDLKEGQDVCHGIDDKYDTIIFLACNQDNTQEAYQENSRMFKALDEYRKEYPKTHLIYISSAAVYTPNSKYAASKRLGEVYAKRFDKYTILRLSNVYGHGDGHGAPDRFMRGEKTIHGDGTQIRDLIPVEEVVRNIIFFIDFRDNADGVYNISTGIGTSVNDMFKMFGTGSSISVKAHDVGVQESILEPGFVGW